MSPRTRAFDANEFDAAAFDADIFEPVDGGTTETWTNSSSTGKQDEVWTDLSSSGETWMNV